MDIDQESRARDRTARARELATATVATMRRHATLLVWLGLALCVCCTVSSLWAAAYYPPSMAAAELGRKEDIHNLYFAASQARWRDIPHWWVGSWIYPNVGFYRPLTSVLYFAEYRLFDRDFTQYNRISVLMTAANAGLLYLLGVSLYRRRPLLRVIVGLVAAYYFAGPANSMYFAVSRIVTWWPSQNDSLSLAFGLLTLVLLDQYLVSRRRGWFAAALLSYYLSLAGKEMGFMVGPMAIALTLYRLYGQPAAGDERPAPHQAAWTIGTFAALSAIFWKLRKILIPHEWGPVLLRHGVYVKGLEALFGPAGVQVAAAIYWPTVAAAAVAVIVVVGLRLRWRVVYIVALAFAAACLCAQFTDGGSYMLMLDWSSAYRFVDVVVYALGAALFFRYRRREPGLFAFAAMLLAYLPNLHYGGYHYFYWPSAFTALCDAVFVACLVRWERELRTGANWDFSAPAWYRRFRAGVLGIPDEAAGPAAAGFGTRRGESPDQLAAAVPAHPAVGTVAPNEET